MTKRGAQECTACVSPNRTAIDAAMRARRAYRWISSQFDVSTATLTRHKDHLASEAIEVVSESRDEPLAAVDAAISELRKLQLRVKRAKNPVQAAELVLKVSRELRSWFSLRFQLAARQPATPIVKHDTEVPEDRLESMAAAFLTRKKEKAE
jgi:hypothetical protein